jgi:hypothetical protein
MLQASKENIRIELKEQDLDLPISVGMGVNFLASANGLASSNRSLSSLLCLDVHRWLLELVVPELRTPRRAATGPAWFRDALRAIISVFENMLQDEGEQYSFVNGPLEMNRQYNLIQREKNI